MNTTPDVTPGASPSSPRRPRRHPLVVATERELLSRKLNEYGLSHGGGPSSLTVAVGRESMRRALRIWDEFIRRVEKAGGNVSISRDKPSKTIVHLDRIDLTVKMYELTTRSAHVPNKSEQEDLRKGREYMVPKWDFTPSGELVFEIEDYLGGNVQRTWTDGKRRKLSEHPDRFFERFRQAIEARRYQEAEWEKSKRESAERYRRQEEERERREKEQKRLENVKVLAGNWETANRIRQFVAAAREGLLRRHGTLEQGSGLLEWLDSAESIAERLDPIPDAFSNLSPQCEGPETLSGPTS